MTVTTLRCAIAQSLMELVSQVLSNTFVIS